MRGPSGLSSRESYPTFLSTAESVQLQLRWAWCGLYDSFRWNVLWRALSSDEELRGYVGKAILLNLVSLAVVWVADPIIAPWYHNHAGWSKFWRILATFWLCVALSVSAYLNTTWVAAISRRAYTLRHGAHAVQPVGYAGMVKAVATSAYRAVMMVTSLLVSVGLGSLPWIGPFAGFVSFCWIDSYYCFEFNWISRGMSLTSRVRHLEERWAYYLAFGLPSTAVCMMGRGLTSLFLFALVYPIYIILSVHANPKPHDPYNPSPLASHDGVTHPSPFVPIRIPIFAFVIWMNDCIVSVITPVSAVKAPGTGASISPKTKRHRGFSDAADSVEEGEMHEMRGVPGRRERVVLSRSKIKD